MPGAGAPMTMRRHRTTFPTSCFAAALAACSTTPAAPAVAENDFVTGLLEASTRRPQAPERIGERQPQRVRSRGLADVELPAVEVELEVRALDARGVLPAPHVARLRLLRFPDVVHLSDPDGGDEWLFRRNPVATDEVSGVRVDHASRFLIDYTDSELASEAVLDGWARLAQLFVSPEELELLRPTGETSEFAGFAFERRVRAGEAAVGELLEVEWSTELGLPRRAAWRTQDGERVQELSALRRADLAERPAGFSERWPEYARKDLSDWREDVHGSVHSGGDHGH